MKKIFVLLVLPLLYSFTAIAAVNCTPISNFPKTYTFTDFPQKLLIKKETPVGSVIHTGKLAVGNGTSIPFMECTGAGSFGYYGHIGSAFSSSISSPGVIPTNIKGIGAKIYFINKLFPNDVLGNTFPSPPSKNPDFYGNETVKIELIKTAEEIDNGVLNTGELLRWGASYEGKFTQIFNVLNTIPTKIIGKTCEFAYEKNKVINFGTIVNKNIANLSGPVPNTQNDIKIGLNCDAGVKVSLTFKSDDKDPTLQSSIVNKGTAKGIFIHFPDIGMLDQENEVIASTTGGYQEINQKVQLYRSDIRGPYTSGSIEAAATYTLNYE
ncbi:type 1 fimbrial protein [Salmonella enterica subsp. enterica]|nr:type 1 fimbrial protein [Salmonella enterica subsp. enterica serovar Kampala]HCB4520149.1 type 1 fimbrial protein [Salmonella enterica]HCB4567665.1 type 1 fimbrial protein [Salmonella enterica]